MARPRTGIPPSAGPHGVKKKPRHNHHRNERNPYREPSDDCVDNQRNRQSCVHGESARIVPLWVQYPDEDHENDERKDDSQYESADDYIEPGNVRHLLGKVRKWIAHVAPPGKEGSRPPR